MRYWKPDHGQGERILELFPQLMGGRHVVSVTGAGGKTSLIWRLAEELRETGRRVVVTTTTHMAWEDGRDWVEAQTENGRLAGETLEQIGGLLARDRCVFTGRRAGEKIAGVLCLRMETAGGWSRLSALADVVLVEADGSRRHPVKVPAPWEPVIPPCTTLVAAVAGLSCLGQSPQACATGPSCGGRPPKASKPWIWRPWRRMAAVCEKGCRRGWIMW
ncbi:MAG: selenium cofactor biosynthesis protein YqeC [Lachnospiraceae bacterium]